MNGEKKEKNIAAEMPLLRPVIEHYTFMALYNVLIDGNKRNWNTIPDAWDVLIVWGFQPLTYSTWVLSTYSACVNVRKTINKGTNEWFLHWQTVLAHNIQTSSLFNFEVYGEEMTNYVKNAIKSA